jgi:hypothetical protein
VLAKVITLSPGMFKEIDVIFRPVERAAYDDAIYIKTALLEGSSNRTTGFFVPVRAHIEKLIVRAVSNIDLGI